MDGDETPGSLIRLGHNRQARGNWGGCIDVVSHLPQVEIDGMASGSLRRQGLEQSEAGRSGLKRSAELFACGAIPRHDLIEMSQSLDQGLRWIDFQQIQLDRPEGSDWRDMSKQWQTSLGSPNFGKLNA